MEGGKFGNTSGCRATKQRDHSESRGGRGGKRKDSTLVSLGTYVPGQVVFVTGWLAIPTSSRPGRQLCSFRSLVRN